MATQYNSRARLRANQPVGVTVAETLRVESTPDCSCSTTIYSKQCDIQQFHQTLIKTVPRFITVDLYGFRWSYRTISTLIQHSQSSSTHVGLYAKIEYAGIRKYFLRNRIRSNFERIAYMQNIKILHV